MAERRALVEGIKTGVAAPADREQDFVYGPKAKAIPAENPAPLPKVGKARISTQIRSDFTQALKRASLERQLEGITPWTMQEILEQALEPWLKANGYLP